MPCDCSHLEATDSEKELSQIACLLDELNGKKRIDRDHWSGYHPQVYGKIFGEEDCRVNADRIIQELCSRLQKLDVTKCSLEMQIWWRDHQEQDREKLKAKQAALKDAKARKKALAKLTPYERKLLEVKRIKP